MDHESRQGERDQSENEIIYFYWKGNTIAKKRASSLQIHVASKMTNWLTVGPIDCKAQHSIGRDFTILRTLRGLLKEITGTLLCGIFANGGIVASAGAEYDTKSSRITPCIWRLSNIY